MSQLTEQTQSLPAPVGITEGAKVAIRTLYTLKSEEKGSGEFVVTGEQLRAALDDMCIAMYVRPEELPDRFRHIYDVSSASSEAFKVRFLAGTLTAAAEQAASKAPAA